MDSYVHIRNISWVAIDHASCASQLMSCNYYYVSCGRASHGILGCSPQVLGQQLQYKGLGSVTSVL